MIILDTTVLSALIEAPLDNVALEWLNRQPRRSVWTNSVSVMELRYGLELMPPGRNRARLVREYEAFITKDLRSRVVPFDHAAAEQAATLMATRRRLGQPRELRDTMIAGIALARRATLATRNLRHFDDLPTPVVDPWAAP